MTDDSCGARHVRLASAIVGIVLVVSAGTIGYMQSSLHSLDARVRSVEQGDAANAARFSAIMERMARIERAVEAATWGHPGRLPSEHGDE